MNLDQKLRLLGAPTARSRRDADLEHQLNYLLKLQKRERTLPGERAAHPIEASVEGEVCRNAAGEFFLAQRLLPFGRPYGNSRIGDAALADLSPLNRFLSGQALPEAPSVLYLDTETTGLAGGTGAFAFLIGIGRAEGSGFRVRQFFLRQPAEEKAALRALEEALAPCAAIVTFNGKAFDLPLLETRYRLARMRPPFERLIHLDLLHPARRVWKLRLESCALKRLEREVLGVNRRGDVDGADIPGIYFDYLKSGEARGLAPVFFHNALDVVSLAVLAAALGGTLGRGGEDRLADGRDLFSLSRIFHRAGESGRALAACRKALDRGLPASVAPRALAHLAAQHKRQGDYAAAVGLWREIVRGATPDALTAYEQLAIYYEHRERDVTRAAEFAQAALERLRGRPQAASSLRRFSHRLDRLRRKERLGRFHRSSNQVSGGEEPAGV